MGGGVGISKPTIGGGGAGDRPVLFRSTYTECPPVEYEDEISDEVKDKHHCVHICTRRHRGVYQMGVELVNRSEQVFQTKQSKQLHIDSFILNQYLVV